MDTRFVSCFAAGNAKESRKDTKMRRTPVTLRRAKRWQRISRCDSDENEFTCHGYTHTQINTCVFDEIQAVRGKGSWEPLDRVILET